MKTFKQFCIEEKTFPSELYHVTSSDKVFKILADDCIKLSFTNIDNDASDRAINKEKYFYLSMSYNKWGRYANLGVQKTSSSVNYTNSILVMDAKALESKGKLIDVDYWGRDDYKNDETEVRFISDTQKFCGLSKLIKEIHIFIPQKRELSRSMLSPSKVRYDDVTIPADTLRQYRKLEDSDINVYFYDNESAFKATLTRGSISLSDAVKRDTKISKSDGRKPRDPVGINDLHALIHLLRGTVPIDDSKLGFRSVYKKYNKLIDSAKPGWGKEFETQTSNDLHNLKRHSPEQFQELVTLIKKLKLNGLTEVREYIHTKYGTKS